MRRLLESAAPEKMEATVSIEQEELRGISRTVAEIEWLLLVLVLLYLVLSGTAEGNAWPIAAALMSFAAFVVAFRYANLYRSETRWKIAIETWAMIAFITGVLWFSGGLDSALLNAYLLPVITSALTLGKLATLFGVGLIAACYVVLGHYSSVSEFYSLASLGALAAQLAPMLLVAYITTMFSADIRYGLNRAKLISETDPLTGLFNMRGFAIAANRLFAQAQRNNRPVSLLMIDSDNLKKVNDGYGHEAGNQLLRTLAKCAANGLRETDVLARYGGDEFIVLLPETPAAGAAVVAERVRNAVTDSPLSVGEALVRHTVTIGIATFPGHGHSLDALAAHADRALYKGKQGGRNRVVASGEPSEHSVPLQAP